MLPVTGATSAAAEVTGDSTSEQALDADITWTEVGNETALNTANKDGVYIKLTDDITLKATLTIAANTTVTLNLNGHKLSSDCTSVIKSIGTLTIVGKGTIEESKSGAYAVWNAGGTVTIGTEDSSDNTDIQVNSTGSYAIYNVTGTMNIYAGTTVWSKSSYTVSNKATLNIYGGMFSNDSAHVIASADSTSANTTISGGTFTAPAAKSSVFNKGHCDGDWRKILHRSQRVSCGRCKCCTEQ
jgi:hypothetical protein